MPSSVRPKVRPQPVHRRPVAVLAELGAAERAAEELEQRRLHVSGRNLPCTARERSLTKHPAYARRLRWSACHDPHESRAGGALRGDGPCRSGRPSREPAHDLVLLRAPSARRVVAAPSADRWHTARHAAPRRASASSPACSPASASPSRRAPFRRDARAARHRRRLRDPLRRRARSTTSTPSTRSRSSAHSSPPPRSCSPSGVRVEIVSNDILATAIGVVWLVGMTNAFNLLDNMDGLAATLAAIACAFFAIDAVHRPPERRRARDRPQRLSRVPRLPALQPARQPPGRRVHGRQRQPDARLRARLRSALRRAGRSPARRSRR